MATRSFQLGLISDTHGLMRPEALLALRGSDHILHAGDIGAPDILTALAELAPVTAVRGNNDQAIWAADLPETILLKFGATAVYLLHDVGTLDLDLVPGGIAVVVSGHSHRPGVLRERGVLFVNPGSAGPRRFKLPVCVATLTLPPAGEAQFVCHDLFL